VKSSPTIELGKLGEQYAAAYLEQLGYRLVAANFTLPVGRNLRGAVINAEIDLIAYDQNTLCFIEVKTRTSDWFAPPQANVDLRKRRQIARAARAYRKLMDLDNSRFRFDVVTVLLSDPLSPQIDLIRNYFAL
jgi:putative endonuclease